MQKMTAASKLHKDTVLIVGSGNIGSRHLQGLAKCNIPLNIFVSDQNEKSLKIAKIRYQEVAKNAQHVVNFFKRLPHVQEDIGICIVATNSDIREQVISEINSKYKVHYWILEKIVAQSVEQLKGIEQTVSSASGCWVNNPRKSLLWHQTIKEKLPKSNEWIVDVKGNNWGLVCNSTHYLDLMEWWTEETLLSIELDKTSTWIHSKRPGFWELKGELIATYSKGSVLILTDSFDSGEELELVIKINRKRWNMNEMKGTFIGSNGFSIPGKLDLQSETTGFLIEKILKDGSCLLPTITESAKLHQILLKGLLTSWQNKSKKNSKIIPVT